MCAAFFVACSAMIWAAVVQYYIYQTNPCGKQASTCDEVSSLNVWIQTGAYVLVGLSEIFGSITGLEYAYTKAPANMRSLVFGTSTDELAHFGGLTRSQASTTSPLPSPQPSDKPLLGCLLIRSW